jgi:DNA polymerase III subunit epsilon
MRRGIEVVPADSRLADRARDYLAAGPADELSLMRAICQMPSATPALAERLAAEALGGRPEFVREESGAWRLARFDEWRSRREPGVSRAARPLSASADGSDSGAASGVARDAVPEAPGAALVPTSAPAADTPLTALSYVVVDVETTGGRAGDPTAPRVGDHRVTEIAAVVVRNGAIEGEIFETLVNPQRSIPPFITGLTGITWDMVADAPTFAQLCPRLLPVLAGNVFVAHNASFDWRFVTTEVSRATRQSLQGPTLCTVRLARRLLPQLARRTLGDVARHYGCYDFDEVRDLADVRARGEVYSAGVRLQPRVLRVRHSAAGDALVTAKVLLRLFEDAAARGIHTWGELATLVSARTGAARRRRRSALPASVEKDTTA